MAGMVLTSGLAAYALIQRGTAQRQTARAEAEARTAQETTRFLVDLFKISDPSEARGNTVTAREMLDKGASRVDRELAKEPAIQARLMDTLGTVYMGLGFFSQARPLIDRAVATRRRVHDVDPLDLSDSLTHQGDLLGLQAEYEAGEKAYREAIRIDLMRPDDRQSQVELANSLYGLGWLLGQAGHYPEAEKNLRAALKLQQALYGASHPAIARTLKDLAAAVADGGDLKSAVPLMQRAVAMQRVLRGSEPHPDLAEVLNDMGLLLYESGDLDGAEKFYRESLAMNRRLLGEKHPEIANGLENVAMSLQDKDDLAGAETLYRQSLEMRRELLGENHDLVGRTMLNLALLQYDRGATEEALASAREVLAIYRKAYPSDNPEIARVLNIIGSWLTMAGEYGDADRYIKEGLAMRRRLFDDRQPDVASSLIALAILQIAEGKYSEALKLAQRARRASTPPPLSADLPGVPPSPRARRGAPRSPGSAATRKRETRLTHGLCHPEQGRWFAAGLSNARSVLLGHPAPARASRKPPSRDTDQGADRLREAGFGRSLTICHKEPGKFRRAGRSPSNKTIRAAVFVLA